MRMNRFCVGMALVVTAITVADAGAALAQGTKLGYVNSQRLMAEAPGTVEATQAFEADMAMYRNELARLEAELDTLQTNFDRQQATLSATVREERQTEMQQKFATYQQRRTQLEETAQRRQAELVAPIMERINVVIEELRVEGSYGLIFDAAAGSFAAADPALDLTDQVLQRLQASP